MCSPWELPESSLAQVVPGPPHLCPAPSTAPLLVFQPQSQTPSPSAPVTSSTEPLPPCSGRTYRPPGEQGLDQGHSFWGPWQLTGSGACSRDAVFAGEVFPVDFKGEGFCLDKEGEGVPGRGARVHVKASVIDGELGALKRRAACTRVGPAASPEGIRTVSCSGALTFYGRVPRHCAMQAHVCPSVCPLLSTSQPDPLLGARTCRRLRSVVSPEQRQDGQAQGRKLETNRLGWEPGASRFRPGLGRLRGGGGFCPGFWRHEHVGLGRTVA